MTHPLVTESSRLTTPKYTLPGLLYLRRMYSFAANQLGVPAAHLCRQARRLVDDEQVVASYRICMRGATKSIERTPGSVILQSSLPSATGRSKNPANRILPTNESSETHPGEQIPGGASGLRQQAMSSKSSSLRRRRVRRLQSGSPAEMVARLAYEKAADVARRVGSGLIIGCDTLAELDGQCWQAADVSVARRILTLLRAESIACSAALRLGYPAKQPDTRVAVTRLRMEEISEAELDEYLESYLGKAKAGAWLSDR